MDYETGNNTGPGDEICYLKNEVASLRRELAKKDLLLEQLSRADEELRESRETYFELSELGREAIILIDNETGRMLEANTAATEMYGYSRDELLQMSNTDLSAEPEATRRVTTETHAGESLVPLRYHRRRDGTVFPVEITGRFFSRRGRNVHVAAIRDVTARRESEERICQLSSLKEQLLGTGSLQARLTRITEGIVTIFGADFARIWMIAGGDLCNKGCLHAAVTTGEKVCPDQTRCLHLMASSGMYTRIDGDHRRVPLGSYKIGRIATGEASRFITNDIGNDPIIHDHGWAKSTGMVSFAGYRLLSQDGKPIGVMVLFKKTPVTPHEELMLGDLANTASQVIIAGNSEEQLRTSLSEKDLLVKEVHHRVKNNLQIITSLLHLQSTTIEDPDSIVAFRESENRIRIMALLHEKLYQSRDLSSIDLGDYVESLVSTIFLSCGINSDRIRLVTEIDPITVGIDVAIPCGLIINELVTNAVKYAFPGDRNGTLTITQHMQADGEVLIVIRDDGPGLPEGMDTGRTTTLGLQLVTTLVSQLEGCLEVKNDGGAVFTIRFGDSNR